MYTSEFCTNTLSFSDLPAWCHTGTLFILYVFHTTYAVLVPLYILLHISYKYCFLIYNFEINATRHRNDISWPQAADDQMYSYTHPEYLITQLKNYYIVKTSEINYLLHKGDSLTFCTQNEVNFRMYFCLILKAICTFMLIWRVPHNDYFSTNTILKSSQVAGRVKTIYATICFL
jgi:hypothetical protein